MNRKQCCALIFFIFSLATLFYFTKPSPAQTIKEPLGLPPIPWPKENPYSKEKAELGRLLYYDERLSSDQTVSCASCHNIPCGYSDCRVVSIGIARAKGSRHSPTIINAAYANHLFWDGRAASLEEQCKGPLANTKEMTLLNNLHQAYERCIERVSTINGYKPLFKKVFGQERPTIDQIAQAIATFERTILSGNSPYDRYQAGDKSALSKEAIEGFAIFKKVGCAECHSGFNFTNNGFENIGIGMDKPNPDSGRYGVTHQEKDWGAFKVPTLREIDRMAPYMHDGSLKSLEEVIDYYDRGGIKNKNLSPLMHPLNLSEKDKKALILFLKSLRGEGWQTQREPDHFPD